MTTNENHELQPGPAGTTPAHESLGQYLVQARRHRNLSREEVALATGISLKTMSALEEDRHDRLPAKVFVRGLIKIYAKELRIPAEEPLALLDRGESEDHTHQSLDRSDVSDLAVSSPMLTSKKILILILLLLAALAIYYGYGPTSDLIQKPLLDEHPPAEMAPSKTEHAPTTMAPPLESKNAPAATPGKSEHPAHPAASGSKAAPETAPATPPAPLTPAVPAAEPTAVPTPAAPLLAPPPSAATESKEGGSELAAPTTPTITASGEFPYVLKAEFIEKTWVKTSIDGQAAVSRTYQPKEVKVWQAKNYITIHLGNAAGARLTLNDEPVANQGKSGQALKLRFPLDPTP